MRGDTLVVDGVVHAYNWTEENAANPLGVGFSQAGYGLHYLMSPRDEHLLSAEEFISDWSDETVEQVVFGETDVDIAVYHSTPLHDYYKDGLVSLKKGVAFKDRNPDRVILYGYLNPLDGQAALEHMEHQVRDYGVQGIKLYPARYYQGRTLPERLDDPKFGIPMIEKALELGVKVIAVHKAIPFGPTQSVYYQLNDFDEVAAQYPEMNFEVVHAGFAFLEETCFLLGRFPNVYVNLEVTASLAINNPRKFAEAIGNFLYWGGEDRIIFATGCSFVHPQPVIDALMDFEIPQDLIEGYGLPQITEEHKRKILGANFCRMHGIDVDNLKARIADDQWAKQKANGRRAPWSAIRNGG